MSPLVKKVIATILFIGTVLILLFQRGIYSKPEASASPSPKPNLEQNQIPTDKAVVVSTKPSPLNEAIILPTQTIEISFNIPLENTAEFKHKLEPKTDYKLELSEDRKIIKIIPQPTFKLGSGFTLSVNSGETKFEGKKRLDQDLLYHFKTIEYKGV